MQDSKKKTGVMVFLGVVVLAAIAKFLPKKGGGGGGAGGGTGGGTPDTWTQGANATISYNDANDISTKIKGAIGYATIDWSIIAKQFERLRNDKDVEMVYRAFGAWDGPLWINGDLFNALNAASLTAKYITPNALKIIKQYSFTYGKYYSW
jgi:hypothetical protein